MKRIIYTCDRCGKEITAERYHITICKEIPAGEPELIANSADRDYCYLCMAEIAVYMDTVPSIVPVREQIAPENEEIAPENEEIAPEETITEHVPPDPEDMEEPEESVMCELREAEAEQRKRRKWLDPEIRDRIIELFNSGEGVLVIAGRLGVDRKAVYNVIHRARKKGLVE